MNTFFIFSHIYNWLHSTYLLFWIGIGNILLHQSHITPETIAPASTVGLRTYLPISSHSGLWYHHVGNFFFGNNERGNNDSHKSNFCAHKNHKSGPNDIFLGRRPYLLTKSYEMLLWVWDSHDVLYLYLAINVICV